MIESPLIQRVRASALQGGIQELLKDRFGSVPRDVNKGLTKIGNEKRLIKLNVLAGKCADLGAFRDALLEGSKP